MNRTLLAKLARLETVRRARAGSDDSRARVLAAREQVAEVLAAFPTEPMPKASVVVRLARAVAEYSELRQSFERMAADAGNGFAAAILRQADRWAVETHGLTPTHPGAYTGTNHIGRKQ